MTAAWPTAPQPVPPHDVAPAVPHWWGVLAATVGTVAVVLTAGIWILALVWGLSICSAGTNMLTVGGGLGAVTVQVFACYIALRGRAWWMRIGGLVVLVVGVVVSVAGAFLWVVIMQLAESSGSC